MLILKIILAILLPPLGILLHEGLTKRFWIDCLLTLLLYLPGLVYALYIILVDGKQQAIA